MEAQRVPEYNFYEKKASNNTPSCIPAPHFTKSTPVLERIAEFEKMNSQNAAQNSCEPKSPSYSKLDVDQSNLKQFSSLKDSSMNSGNSDFSLQNNKNLPTVANQTLLKSYSHTPISQDKPSVSPLSATDVESFENSSFQKFEFNDSSINEFSQITQLSQTPQDQSSIIFFSNQNGISAPNTIYQPNASQKDIPKKLNNVQETSINGSSNLSLSPSVDPNDFENNSITEKTPSLFKNTPKLRSPGIDSLSLPSPNCHNYVQNEFQLSFSSNFNTDALKFKLDFDSKISDSSKNSSSSNSNSQNQNASENINIDAPQGIISDLLNSSSSVSSQVNISNPEITESPASTEISTVKNQRARTRTTATPGAREGISSRLRSRKAKQEANSENTSDQAENSKTLKDVAKNVSKSISGITGSSHRSLSTKSKAKNSLFGLSPSQVDRMTRLNTQKNSEYQTISISYVVIKKNYNRPSPYEMDQSSSSDDDSDISSDSQSDEECSLTKKNLNVLADKPSAPRPNTRSKNGLVNKDSSSSFSSNSSIDTNSISSYESEILSDSGDYPEVDYNNTDIFIDIYPIPSENLTNSNESDASGTTVNSNYSEPISSCSNNIIIDNQNSSQNTKDYSQNIIHELGIESPKFNSLALERNNTAVNTDISYGAASEGLDIQIDSKKSKKIKWDKIFIFNPNYQPKVKSGASMDDHYISRFENSTDADYESKNSQVLPIIKNVSTSTGPTPSKSTSKLDKKDLHPVTVRKFRFLDDDSD
ncbi:hypothetical protein AYI69_g10157 [Smittium culicis]|uniref:Uncharacterized protein n=1 Tax=Smittium culicis TaxID=133412 RepID=A0A1R1X7N2_9FUNG|nr:hypothetical protein AYI69_g11056 [Smittium culicis]OMJ10637.1 hypothetical protein AYI69_g10157 [Smittium culicis]